ncbi:putative AB hydrolase-1 domain-containing protein [Seiridium cardinale]
MNNFKDRTATLPDGREIAHAIYGIENEAAPTIFYFHGFPGSHQEGYLAHDAAMEHGIRIIAPSRPGFCSSTFQPDRTITDYPDDVLALAEALSAHRFAILGVSGGGPYAIACLRAIPRDRLVGVGLVASVMPPSFGTAGMLTKTRAMFWVAPRATWLLGRIVEQQIGPVARDEAHPEKLEIMMDREIESRSPIDGGAWLSHPDLRTVLLRSSREAMRQGGYPTAWEARLYGSDWGFSLEDIKVNEGQMVLWHGDKDVNGPVSNGEKAMAAMSGAKLRVMKGDSHMTLMTRVDEFMAVLKAMLSK